MSLGGAVAAEQALRELHEMFEAAGVEGEEHSDDGYKSAGEYKPDAEYTAPTAQPKPVRAGYEPKGLTLYPCATARCDRLRRPPVVSVRGACLLVRIFLP